MSPLEAFEQQMTQGRATAASAQRGLPPQVFAGVGSAPASSARTKLPLGAASLPRDTGIAFGVAYIALAGVSGFFAGKAMAPSPSQQMGYAAIGTISSIILGPLGLGALGIYSLVKR